MICLPLLFVTLSMNNNRTYLFFSGWSETWWINLIGFQLAWWLSVLYGNQALPIVAALIAVHLLLHSTPSVELIVLVSCALLGMLVDTVLTRSGIFVFTQDHAWPPVWLVLLWLSFSATLRQGLHWFKGRYLLSALVGSLAGAASYLAAGRLGAVIFGVTEIEAALLLALIWMMLFPALMKLASAMEKQRVLA